MRIDGYGGFLLKSLFAERVPPFYSQRFYLGATRHHATAIIAEYDDRFIQQVWPE